MNRLARWWCLLLIWGVCLSFSCATEPFSGPTGVLSYEDYEEVRWRRAAFAALPQTPLLAAALDPTLEIQDPLTSPFPAQPPAVPAGQPSTARAPRWGLRYGMVFPADPDWKLGVRAGAHYRAALPNGMPLELGLDYAALETEDEAVSSETVYLRADIVLRRQGHVGGRLVPCPVAGVEVAYERAEFALIGEETAGFSPGLNLGLALGAASGRWDVRLLYSLMIGGGAVAGEGLVAGTICF